ncbi:hypothetical protein BX600DRAFT_457001 [Xylariales sp. PMI_506]|nr:hypothetical protein BX600DRAFT_457001 [Xylariales sp. PMI_506]
MKAPGAICLVCRSQLATRSASQAAQWRTRASYSTTPGLDAHGHDAPAADQQPPASGTSRKTTRDGPRAQRAVSGTNKRASSFPLPPPPRSSRGRRHNADPKTTVDVNELFQQIVNRQNPKNADDPEVARLRTLDMALVEKIGRLQQLLDTGAPILTAYNFLKAEIYPVVHEKGVQVPQVFYIVVSNVMQSLISAKEQNMWAPDMPSVAEIFRVCADIGDMRVGQWFDLVHKLVEHLCETSSSPSDYPSIEEYEKHLNMRDEVLWDLVESWKVLSLPKHMAVKPSGDTNEIIDGFWFPRLDKFAVKKYARTNNFTMAMNVLFSQYNQNILGNKLPVLAVATFTLLLDNQKTNVSARRDASRFIAKIAHMITLVGLNHNSLRKSIATTYPSIEEYVMGQWPDVREYLKGFTQTSEESAEWKRSAAPANSTKFSPEAVRIGKKLAHAYGTRNVSEVDRLWHSFAVAPLQQAEKEERNLDLSQYSDLFDSFINTYMAMNQPDKAIDVWNLLSRVGLKPTVKTWNVMLDGCKKARNREGLQTVWQKLAASGAQLDVAIWTTRVAGLMDCDDPKGAINALEEMVTLWSLKSGKQSSSPMAVEPAIQPVNAALQGLIRLNNIAGAQKLLAWAKSHNIDPDTVTFNLLLRPLIRDGRDREVDAVFKTMKALGVQADAATFTIILDGTLTRLDARDSEKQTEIVSATFREMQAAGLQANLQTYGKMIHLLLRSGDLAQESVKVVLAHLWAQGHELSPHIYTILVQHYFSRRPPDLAAVDSLLQRRRLLDYDDMDRVFYDRVIKGYALVGDTKTAFTIYRKLSAAGYLVDLSTQYEVLRSLVQSDRLEEAKSLVEDTIKKYEAQHGKAATWRGHSFWHLAARSGIATWTTEATGGRAFMVESS